MPSGLAIDGYTDAILVQRHEQPFAGVAVFVVARGEQAKRQPRLPGSPLTRARDLIHGGGNIVIDDFKPGSASTSLTEEIKRTDRKPARIR